MKSERREIWIALIFAVLLTVLAFVSVGCAADTYTVCPNGCEYTSIQAAINAAQLGDIIEVHSGTYYENVNVTKQLTLHGVDTGSGKPVVDAMNQGSAITLSVDGILLDGFYVSNSSPRVSMIGWAEITGAGIKVISNDNNLTNNTAINNNGIGMFIWGGYNNTLIGNKAINNEEGINLYQSGDNTLRNNQMLDNHYNFVGHFEDDIDISNTVDGKPIYYLVGVSDVVVGSDSNAGTVYLINCENIIIKDLELTKNAAGIYLYETSNSYLLNNHINNNCDGIWLIGSNFNNASGNEINNNGFGIYLYSSSNNSIAGNTAINNYCGIYLHRPSSSNNLIYNNYFCNTNNALDDGNNIWNISKTPGTNILGGSWLGGNYWSDYAGVDTDGDGLGDTLIPYNCSGNITSGGDWLPLVKTEEEPFTQVSVGVTSNISLADPEDITAYLPPEYDGMNISDAVVLNVDVTDDTPGNTANDAYTDITINVGDLNIATCKVFKSDMGFLPEVPDVTTLPTVKPPGEPAFSRNVANNTVTVRLYVGDPLLAVLPPAALTFSLDLVTGLNLISMPINDPSITTAASLAAKLGSNCTEVVAFNTTQQQLQSYVPGVPLNNFAIASAEGYFVNLNNPTSVVLTGTGGSSPFQISLVPGMNLIGMPVNDTAVTTASTLAAKIGTSCQEVVNWESGTQSYVSYVTGVPLNDFAIRAGDGYFVTVDGQTEVTFEGGSWGN